MKRSHASCCTTHLCTDCPMSALPVCSPQKNRWLHPSSTFNGLVGSRPTDWPNQIRAHRRTFSRTQQRLTPYTLRMRAVSDSSELRTFRSLSASFLGLSWARSYRRWASLRDSERLWRFLAKVFASLATSVANIVLARKVSAIGTRTVFYLQRSLQPSRLLSRWRCVHSAQRSFTKDCRP